MDNANSVVCICETHEQAKQAMRNLEKIGIDPRTLSIANRDISPGEHGADYYVVGDQTFSIPGTGPVLVRGPLAGWIVTAFADGGGKGLNAVGMGLATLGIRPDRVLEYEAALSAGRYLLVLHGSLGAVTTAVKVIGGTMHCSHTVHGEMVYDTLHETARQQMYTYQA